MVKRQGCMMCPDHGHIHGQEAEELRKGIEALLGETDAVESIDLQKLLDDTDARDSLAFLESQDR